MERSSEPDAKSSSWTVPGADGIEVVVLATAVAPTGLTQKKSCVGPRGLQSRVSRGRGRVSCAPPGARSDSLGSTASSSAQRLQGRPVELSGIYLLRYGLAGEDRAWKFSKRVELVRAGTDKWEANCVSKQNLSHKNRGFLSNELQASFAVPAHDMQKYLMFAAWLTGAVLLGSPLRLIDRSIDLSLSLSLSLSLPLPLSLCMYIYIYMYYIYIYMYVCMCTYVCLENFTHMYACMYVCMYVGMFTCNPLLPEVLHDGAANRWIKHGPHDFEFEMPRHEATWMRTVSGPRNGSHVSHVFRFHVI